MATLRIPRGSSPDLQFTVKNADGTPMNLTGLPVEVVDSTMPIVAVASIINAATGLCRLLFPDTTPLQSQKSYEMRLRVGVPGAPGTFTTPLFEVIAI
jgi:hypothetical protein